MYGVASDSSEDPSDTGSTSMLVVAVLEEDEEGWLLNIAETVCLRLADRKSVGNQVSYWRSTGSWTMYQGVGEERASSFPEKSVCGRERASSSKKTESDMMFSDMP